MNSDIFPAFYLSAVTPLGFVSRLSSLCDRSRLEHVYLLKGGSRSLRSQFILDAAAHAENFSKEAALVPSALERDKFEAAFWDNTAVIDAAPPYCIEPLIPSAFEDVLWLGGCYKKELRHKLPEFIELKNCEDELTEQSRKLLFAADELLKDNGRAALCCTDTDKIELQAARTAKNISSPRKKVLYPVFRAQLSASANLIFLTIFRLFCFRISTEAAHSSI